MSTKEYNFLISRTAYSSGVWSRKQFPSDHGIWKTSITQVNNYLFGYITLKSNIEMDKKFMKQVKVKVEFGNNNCRNFDTITAELDEDESFFYFNPFKYQVSPRLARSGFGQLSNLSENLIYFDGNYGPNSIYINIKISAPVIKSSTPPNNSKELSKGVKSHLKEMFESQKLGDITMNTKLGQFKVHKFILMRSGVFEKMLNNLNNKEVQLGIIEIKDIEHDVIYEMCRYLYIDEIPKIQSLAICLLVAADKYMIPELVAECENYLIKNMELNIVCNVLIVADRLNVMKLKETAVNFVIKNRKTIFSSEGWKLLKESYMPLAMEVMEKFVADA